jgi:monovalent cation:proton antiporter-2 (CPA2) family protein
MAAVHALTPVILLLLVGILAITLVRPLGLSPIVGYLAAGLVIGPHALGLVPESETTHLLAELGVVFLLFDIGLHFSLASIWEARRDILGLGPLQIVLCALAFGGIAAAFGLGGEYALILGGTLALSSTAVVVQTLAERGQQNCPVGLTGTAVLIFQDICAIFILILASSIASADASPAGPGLAGASLSAALKAAAAFLAAVLIGRYAIRPLFRLLARSRNEEVFTATALLVVLATAAATGVVDLSLTLGAFLGGMMIAETPYRHVIQTEARPFRDLLLGFFFITVGMSLDWRVLMADWAQILVFLAALVGVKAVLVAVAARAFGWSTPGSVQLGFLLAQGSEFAFVILAMPAVRSALGEGAVGAVITAVAASLALTPTLAGLGNGLARTLRRRSAAAAPAGEITPSATTAAVVVFGMDDVGRSVADALEANGVAYDAVEMDYDRFLAASADGYPVAFGDVGDVRLMETLRMAERSAVVVTIVRYEISSALTPIMRDRYPNLIRFIAVDDDGGRARFEAIGMRAVVSRSVPRGLDLAAAVLRSQGVDEAKILAWMQRQQERALGAAAARGATPVAA